MKKIFYYGAFIALIGGVFIACQKQEITPSVNKTEKYTQKSTQTPVMYYNDISDADITQIGINHNSYLQTTFNTRTINLTTIRNNFLNLNVPNLNLSQKTTILDNTTAYNMNYLNTNIVEQQAKTYLQNSIDIVENSINYLSIKNNLQSLKLTVKADANCVNKAVVLIQCEVLLQSAYFWSPVSEGGSGIGESILNKIGTPKISKFAKGLIEADGLAASCTFTGYGLLAGVTGPMGWGALVATVGFSAAWSSGYYAVANW